MKLLQKKYFYSLVLGASFAAMPLFGQNSKDNEPGELKLKLIAFQGKKSHSIRIKLDWGTGKSLDNGTWATRVKGEAEDALGRFNYVATRVANPEWTEYTLWINYAGGKRKNQSLRLSWVTHGHEPPNNSIVADGVWIFGAKHDRVTGTAD